MNEFIIKISADYDDGHWRVLNIDIIRGQRTKVTETVEVIDGGLMIDFDAQHRLVCIEILGVFPSEEVYNVIDKYLDNNTAKALKQALINILPNELVKEKK